MHHHHLWRLLVLIISCSSLAVRSEPWLVEEGQGRAQIIIAPDAVRAVELAAEQLQDYLEQISGAKLPILTDANPQIPVRIFVGESAYTEALGIQGDDYLHGGFRMVSGDDWLALVGRDRPFQKPAIMFDNYSKREEVQTAWDEATGEHFGYPFNQLPKEFHRELGIWERDEHGSFNATTQFLRDLGVRWYLPDEMGEVVPRQATIALPKLDREVRPDFIVREPLQWARRFSYGWTSRKEALWQWRMGWHHASEMMGYGLAAYAHGINDVTSHEKTKELHPEYYALYGDKRETDFRHGGKPCLSSQGLLEANIRYGRAVYDILGANKICVMPADAFTSLCQCADCTGKSQPDRGYRGVLTNYVWGYVDQVARGLYQTHPDKWVTCASYGTYWQPPTNIEQFPPNLIVTLCQHRFRFYDDEIRTATLDTRQGFLDLLPDGGKSRIIINEKYRTGRPLPMVYPRRIAEDLKSLKGIALGGSHEVFRSNNRDDRGGIHYMADMGLNLYVTSRLWWDADQDIDELLDEYYRLYYGPAREPMKAFLEFSEQNWYLMDKDAALIDRAFELIAAAEETVQPETIYGRRVAHMRHHIAPLEGLKQQLTVTRDDAPWAQVIKLRREFDETVTLDGKLDEAAWQRWPSYELKELTEGGEPSQTTRFRVAWQPTNSTLYFGITCYESDMENLNVGTDQDEDMAVFEGDSVEILLETLTHPYYQLAISPSGALLDIDRAKRIETRWSSEAEVKPHHTEDAWTVEIAIPMAGNDQATILPLSGVSGSTPTPTYPWFFNVCRQRVRGDEMERSAFSPTGESGFHVPAKFGRLHTRPRPAR